MGGNRVTLDEKSSWARMYSGGMNIGEIVDKTGRCYPTVSAGIRACGVQLKSCSEVSRTKKLNESVFDRDSPESRYWLGFLMADGWVSRSGNHHLALRLSAKDVSHLAKFQKFLETDVAIRFQAGGFNGSGQCASLTVISKHLVERLASFGIGPQKSFTAKTPPELAKDRDFWRGMVDGDGWLWYRRKPASWVWDVEFGLCGTADICRGFSEFLRHTLGSTARGKSDTIRKNGPIWKSVATGYRALRAAETFYSDACVALDRKLEMAEAFSALASGL